jgi:hypothetical protein
MGKIIFLLKEAAEFLPFVGEFVDNVKSKDGGVGRFFTPRFVKQAIRLILTLIAFYLLIKGQLSPEQVDGFINGTL